MVGKGNQQAMREALKGKGGVCFREAHCSRSYKRRGNVRGK